MLNRFSTAASFVIVSACFATAFLSPDRAFGQASDGLGGFETATTPDLRLSEAILREIENDLYSQKERNRLAIFHGQYEMVEDPTPIEQAKIALAKRDLNNEALKNENVPALVRAEASLLRGDVKQAIDLLADDDSPPALLIRAQAHEQLGEFAKIVELLQPWRERVQFERFESAADLTAATEGVLLLARIEGRPGDDYKLALQKFAEAQQINPFHYPALLGQARLLTAKGVTNPKKPGNAIETALATLKLNDRCAEALFLLGQINLDEYKFPEAVFFLNQIREINPEHILAASLKTRIQLQQRKADAALKTVDKALASYPRQRELLALRTAAATLSGQQEVFEDALANYRAASPQGIDAEFLAGHYLAMHGEPTKAEALLASVLKRQPNWPAAHGEMSRVKLQLGKAKEALDSLRIAARLDPFDLKISNRLTLLSDVARFRTIETPHFVIRFKSGLDEVLGRDVAIAAEAIYAATTKLYGHEPAAKTNIEIMPDAEYFAVRLTGEVKTDTVAATVGKVITLARPRSGRKQAGTFDWYNALLREFTYVLTMDLSDERAPHWFAVGCGASREINEWKYQRYQLLARNLERDTLFELGQLNYGFIAPVGPTDKPLAEGQSAWIVQFIIEKFGHNKVVEMLQFIAKDATIEEAIEKATGQTPNSFVSSFMQWGAQQVNAWGLGIQPDIAEVSILRNPKDLTDQRLSDLLKQYPEHPDLLKIAAMRAVKGTDFDKARQAVLAYASSRPVDDWSYRQLVTIAARADKPDEVVKALEVLDRHDDKVGKWAYELAKMYRQKKELDKAARAADRALHRDPYNGTFRELAATIQLQRGDTDAALHHMISLSILEPQKSIHLIRLAAFYHKLGEIDKAHEAAVRAKQIDENAPVERFMKEEKEGSGE